MIINCIRKTRVLWSAGMALGMIVVAQASICDWGWEQDGCKDVYCPPGCTEVDVPTPTYAACVQRPGDLCCTCWYRERVCVRSNNERCFRRRAPNPYFWYSYREETAGPCIEFTRYGTYCIAANGPPWWSE